MSLIALADICLIDPVLTHVQYIDKSNMVDSDPQMLIWGQI